MASRLSIENDRLKVGQVKRVTSNNGNKIDSITLLLNESVEVLFAPNGRACGHFFRPLCLYSFYNLED